MDLIISEKEIAKSILWIREQKVMLDADLARLYGVSTKRLNEQVKRNQERFPATFMFQLTEDEKQKVVANCDHLINIKYSHKLPYAFTEHGAVMLANVLKSQRAIFVSIEVVKTFIHLREALISHHELAHKITNLEKKYDAQFQVVFDALRKLIEPENPPPKRRIGF